MPKPLPRGLALAALMLVTAMTVARADERGPEDVLRRYLAALQRWQFGDAYDLVSAAMKTDRKTKQVKSKEVWVKESQYLFSFSGTKIFAFKVGKGEIEGEEALVPNILSSQDKFLNQLGVDEYELYTLVKENGAWKVDQQQEVIERAELAKWFPGTGTKP